MMTKLLMVSEEQEKIAFKENRTCYLLAGWGDTLKREWRSETWNS